MSIKDLYLYLGRAVMCIPERYQEEVYKGMAAILMEWTDTPRSELRKVFKHHDIKFEEMCIHCNEPMPDWDAEEDGEPACEACKAEEE